MPESAGFSRTGSWVGRTLGFESPWRNFSITLLLAGLSCL